MINKLINGINISFKNDIRLFFNYIIFAGIAASIDIAILYYMTEFLRFWYFYSAAMSYTAGMAINYSLNKYFNFRNGYKKLIPQFGIFVIIASIGLGLNQLIIYFIVESYKLEYMSAKFVTLLIVAFWSFYGHKNLTFEIYK